MLHFYKIILLNEMLVYFVSSRGFGYNFQLEIHHLSIKSKAENWLEHWTAVSFCLELFSSAHQRSLVGTEPATSQLESSLLKSPKQNETAAQCSSQFSAFDFTD